MPHHGDTHLEFQYSGGRCRWISELKANLIYRVSSWIARAIQRNPVSKNKTKQTNKQKKSNQNKNPTKMKEKKNPNQKTNKQTKQQQKTQSKVIKKYPFSFSIWRKNLWLFYKIHTHTHTQTAFNKLPMKAVNDQVLLYKGLVAPVFYKKLPDWFP